MYPGYKPEIPFILIKYIITGKIFNYLPPSDDDSYKTVCLVRSYFLWEKYKQKKKGKKKKKGGKIQEDESQNAENWYPWWEYR